MTPLGFPVVPDVYINVNKSLGFAVFTSESNVKSLEVEKALPFSRKKLKV